MAKLLNFLLELFQLLLLCKQLLNFWKSLLGKLYRAEADFNKPTFVSSSERSASFFREYRPGATDSQ